MAKLESSRKKPRVRKTAPTVRARVEAVAAAEQKKQESKKPAKTNRRLPGKKVLKPIAKPFRLIGKALAWLMPRYFINSWRELRQVSWPSRRETWKLTGAVFVFALIFGALVSGVDKIIDDLFKKIILK